ncbi:single-stranded DNA-binding protein [bacterium]|nr:single-stranded DNA-binding protein [bacterium]
MNITILKGNLARDPELRVVGSGDRQTSVVNFTVATSREFTKANGTQDKITSFIPCEAWDSGAEAIAATFKKGDLVMIEGSLRNDSWEKDGVKHSTLKIRVNNFGKIQKTKKTERQGSDETSEKVAF